MKSFYNPSQNRYITKMKRCVLICIFLLPVISQAQVVIGTNAQVVITKDTDLNIQANGNLINNGTVKSDEANLLVTLLGDGANIVGNWNVNSFVLNADNNHTLSNGTLTIRKSFDLQNGVIQVQSAKLLFTGNANDLTVANNFTWISGPFTQAGKGFRLFPLGSGGSYTPFVFTDVKTDEEIEVQVFETDAALTTTDPSIVRVDNTRYYEVISTDFAGIKSPASISINFLSNPDNNGFTVVQAPSVGGVGTSLGNSSNDELSVTSRKAVTEPILAVGFTTEIDVKIHDLLTPFITDGVNDAIFIENLDKFETNMVKLLDRWGVVVKEWKDYDNANPGYDFSKLSPGSYICIAEVSNAGSSSKQLSQMITVLKTN